MQQKILSRSVIGAGKFLVLKDLSFQDDRGRLRHWEAVDRDGEASAVFIIARIVPDDEILFVRQFRPPTGRLMLEFPAGLIDPGETPAETAVRLSRESALRLIARLQFPRAYRRSDFTGDHGSRRRRSPEPECDSASGRQRVHRVFPGFPHSSGRIRETSGIRRSRHRLQNLHDDRRAATLNSSSRKAAVQRTRRVVSTGSALFE